MDVDSFLNYIKTLPWYHDQIAHLEPLAPRNMVSGTLNVPLDPTIVDALESVGITHLYKHQADSIDAIRSGGNVIVSTSAASGKSLCYNVPIVEDLLTDRSARAIYLFPTKALAQDQAQSLSTLIRDFKHLRLGIFDGDTSQSDRTQIRRNARILMTNPDMLHLGILPNHKMWYAFIKNLKYIVVDEAHIYRGVFGSHVANVIRRLVRLCRIFGAVPQFILCSATISNPGEHAVRLVGKEFQVIQWDGSPSGGNDFVFWNPPKIEQGKNGRKSTNTESAALFAELIKSKVRSLAFVRSRKAAELVYLYSKDHLLVSGFVDIDRIRPYRASYLPEERRNIERDLMSGQLLGVTTTNALELGVDIGYIDAVVIVGYPGTIASTWQQAGRGGRRGDRSLSILVAQDNPLDQYLMRHPGTFFEGSYENARISPANPHILKPHLLCAAYEAPISLDDTETFGIDMLLSLNELKEEGLIVAGEKFWYLDPGVEYPAQSVSIRSVSSEIYTLVDKDTGVVLETINRDSAFHQLHQGSIYLHQGQEYRVDELDIESFTASATRVDAQYYTQAVEFAKTDVISCLERKNVGTSIANLGTIEVSNHVVGFKRKSHETGEVLSLEYLDLPPFYYDTVALWLDVPESVLEICGKGKRDLLSGLHALEHVLVGVVPLFTMCDNNDVGGFSTSFHVDTGRPQIFIYDAHAGGVGISEHSYEILEELLKVARDVVEECSCDLGCPACIQSSTCSSDNNALDKDLAIAILRHMLVGE